ncbi:MAG: ABC transporter ATP-binding protein [Desulfurococcales archaeon]|nr:ABC transporter ATP-binding protein [Desulfurococcales archaeon]
MGEIIVEVRNLTKKIGKKPILHNINLTVERGSIHAVLGPNGAGKTTLLRTILGIYSYESGKVMVLGYKMPEQRSIVNKLISYLPEDAQPYERLTGYENLFYYALIYSGGIRETAEKMVELGIKLSNLGDAIYEKTGTYSKGMKRRLLLARTLMCKPKLAVLDEPTSGVDVVSSHKLRQILKEAVKNGTTILLSGHNILEIENIATHVSFINNGTIVAEGSTEQVKRSFSVANLEEAFLKAVGAT